MQRKTFTVLLAAATLLTGCSGAALGTGASPAQSVSSAPAPASSVASSAPAESTPADDFSALPESAQLSFQAATDLYAYFLLCPPACDETVLSINGMSYRHVSDPAFPDYATFYRTLTGCFTQDFIDGELLSDGLYVGVDGLLYTRVEKRDPNTTFTHAQAQLLSQTETDLHFLVTAYYTDGSVRTVEYAAVLQDGRWLFSQFGGYL